MLLRFAVLVKSGDGKHRWNLGQKVKKLCFHLKFEKAEIQNKSLKG